MWLSEVMLQQTTVATVLPRFDQFLRRWPTIHALAEARDEEILCEWAGLGYYARARNLIACAREIARRGGFPTTSAGLRSLPGLGPYSSAAIAAIAFGEKAPAVDTNVERVVARLEGVHRAKRPLIERLVAGMMPQERPGDFVQAMMDLGATICRPRNPRCVECPLKGDCKAFASGNPAGFPERRERATRPSKYGVAYWTERGGSVWLVRRPAKGLLGGMSALPGHEWTSLKPEPMNALGTVHHLFTHFSLELTIIQRSEPDGQGWWQSLDRLDEAGLPTLYRKSAELVLSNNDRLAA